MEHNDRSSNVHIHGNTSNEQQPRLARRLLLDNNSQRRLNKQ